MAREELRGVLIQNWREAIDEAKMKGTFTKHQQRQVSRATSNDVVHDTGLQDFFDHLSGDTFSAEQRALVLRQYENVYDNDEPTRSDMKFPLKPVSDHDGDESILSRYVYPLNSAETEKEWILGHNTVVKSSKLQRSSSVWRVNNLLDRCIPSKLLQSDILPVNDLRPECCFDFRALAMPQRRYFFFSPKRAIGVSYLRQGCGYTRPDDVHWTLGFTISSFAGEFSDPLIQCLYRCPLIRGLSFARSSDREFIRKIEKDNAVDDGNAILSNLAALLPPRVLYMTYDNVLNTGALQGLVAILKKMKELNNGGGGLCFRICRVGHWTQATTRRSPILCDWELSTSFTGRVVRFLWVVGRDGKNERASALPACSVAHLGSIRKQPG